ncbi:hypothetical protein DIE07_08720 [Burkholderia sp. Bp9002]|nr:hypothetical protein DIE07_08720 [Burkholderia sp. Bp9002]
MNRLLIGCECIDSSHKEILVRQIAQAGDEPRVEPMKCNVDTAPPGESGRHAAAARGGTRTRAPFVGKGHLSSACSAIRRTMRYRCTDPAKVAAWIEYLGRCPCWRPA